MAMTAPQEVPGAFDPGNVQQQMQAILQMAGGLGAMGAPGMQLESVAAGVPQVDPVLTEAYMRMFQYLQQGLTQPEVMGMPSMPFPGAAPYTPPVVEPSVTVTVEGMKFQYQLTEDDLQKVFSRYGAVKQIRVDEVGASALITFHNFQDAQASMNDLNGKVLNGLDGTLRIQWSGANDGNNVVPPYPTIPLPGWGGFPPAPTPATDWPPGAVAATTPPRMGLADGGAGADRDRRAGSTGDKGVRKYTCRFVIGIENDKDFQVARRIIGAKGANMKRIVTQTEAKLRLRGQGSGYFEGAQQKESQEPLQLCISCTSTEGYKTAVRQAEELIKRVYEEYRVWCTERGQPTPALPINFSENQLVYSSSKTGGGPGVGSPGEGDTSGFGSPGSTPQRESQSGRRNRRSRGKRDTAAGQPMALDEGAGAAERGEPGPHAPSVEEIEKLVDQRNEARRANNFAEADRIRQMLHSSGVALMDEPGGRGRGAEVTTWRYWRY